ncbi:alpha/beta hydrolase family protein [Pseudotabrizicola sp. L79]|uniref:alpha/beta hydrolase family protein n=1 Tax=Pseudotabrizicola sp. L79 TaxID=3118402 RepID=UPI002F94DE1B
MHIFFKAISAATLTLGLIWATSAITRPPYDGRAGIAYAKATAPLRGQSLDVHLWYPTEPGGRAVTVGGNGVFHGTPAGRGAPPAPGRHPLIVMSHGAGGNAGQFGWIASKLAAAGYVVALPNHPGSTSGNASAIEAARIWQRPQDVTAVLDEITSHPQDYPFVAPARIGVLGFSAGGYTALALSGARVDPARLAAFCDAGGRGMSDCDFFARFGVDLHAIDLTPAAQDLRDDRIGFAVVVDPGIVETLTSDSLGRIDLPMLVINLGAEAHVPAPVHARALSETVPGAQYRLVADATHFSFLAECTPKGPAILVAEGEADPLCTDAGGRSRGDIHAELADTILQFLGTAAAAGSGAGAGAVVNGS